MNAFARVVLLLLTGHLICLAGFEWSRFWPFFPGPVRWGVFPLVTISAFLSLDFLTEKERRIAVSGMLLVVWSAATGFILWLHAWQRATVAGLLGLILCAGIFSGKRRVAGLLGTALLTGAAYLSMPPAVVGVVLLLCYLLEARHLTVADLDLSAVEALKDKLPGEALAEISWRGFAQLYSACDKGEGEKFSRRVLTDTVSVVSSCGGELQSGSEHRGVYRFPSYASRRECRRVLLEYQEQLDGVLEPVGAPVVRVYFREL